MQCSDCFAVPCSITAMKNRKIKMALGTVFLVGAGVAIPAWAVGLSAALYPPSPSNVASLLHHRFDNRHP